MGHVHFLLWKMPLVNEQTETNGMSARFSADVGHGEGEKEEGRLVSVGGEMMRQQGPSPAPGDGSFSEVGRAHRLWVMEQVEPAKKRFSGLPFKMVQVVPGPQVPCHRV